ncbi:MAG: hypothetical protein FJW37_05600 [Acidobacteria bacterium]|nr:hypothetical protein [Acidobacteriota bacterium]
MPLTALRLVRKMRGGAQAHLLETEDGGFYVVKFQNNPQHRRILVNELIAAELLRYLQLSTPEVALSGVSWEFLDNNPDVCIRMGSQRVEVAPGWHFGSRHPGHPERTAIYDFIPDVLLKDVSNLADFLGMLVFDKWAANADGRQAIFLRARVRDWDQEIAGKNPKSGFVALMIDHGYVFQGPHWNFEDSPLQGLCARNIVYHGVRSLESFEPWLTHAANLPEEVVDRAWKQVPREWIQGDEEELEKLLERLLRRRRLLPDLLRLAARARPEAFPGWRARS